MSHLTINKTILIIAACIILAAVITIICIFFIQPSYLSATAVFKRKFGFALPESAVIMKYDYTNSFFDEERLSMKVQFDVDDYAKIEEGMSSYFKYFSMQQIAVDRLPNFSNTCSWWDMNVDDIVNGGNRVRRGKKVMTISLYAFITKNEDGQYFLYIDE